MTNTPDPYAPGVALTAPAGTKVYNAWIWLVVLLPYVTLPFLFTIDVSGFFRGLDYADATSATRAQLELMTTPGFLILTLGGWVVTAAVVLFSWLDWRWLNAAGVPRPFHWAFAFFGLAGYPVYAIGRAVVTRRRTGKGIAVLWVTIALIVLSFVVSIAWAASLVNELLRAMPLSGY